LEQRINASSSANRFYLESQIQEVERAIKDVTSGLRKLQGGPLNEYMFTVSYIDEGTRVTRVRAARYNKNQNSIYFYDAQEKIVHEIVNAGSVLGIMRTNPVAKTNKKESE
jgi:hypothetical protein